MQEKPFFVNRVEDFGQVLSDIEAFAKKDRFQGCCLKNIYGSQEVMKS